MLLFPSHSSPLQTRNGHHFEVISVIENYQRSVSEKCLVIHVNDMVT